MMRSSPRKTAGPGKHLTAHAEVNTFQSNAIIGVADLLAEEIDNRFPSTHHVLYCKCVKPSSYLVETAGGNENGGN